jgi:hypothetical protein
MELDCFGNLSFIKSKYLQIARIHIVDWTFRETLATLLVFLYYQVEIYSVVRTLRSVPWPQPPRLDIFASGLRYFQ